MSHRRNHGKLIVPVFIPNQGCPHRCVYCRQEDITGTGGVVPGPPEVRRIIDTAVRSKKFASAHDREIAFYGGTFTGLSPGAMEALLAAAFPRVADGSFHGIRVSTRPDALDEERLSLMKSYGVTTVELGVQSLHDDVLRRTRRGYLSEDVKTAADMLGRFGFRLGVQLMPGLPGDDSVRFLETVKRALELEPALVRLYPTLVIRGTVLAAWYRRGAYRPFSLEEAVGLCTEACIRFETAGVPVIRIGLLAPDRLAAEGGILAGPWHPAFGFLVRSAVYHRGLERLFPRARGPVRIRVHPRDACLVRGYRNQGLGVLASKTGTEIAEIVTDDALGPGSPVLERVN
jgi:histone acetyltransferase (RNA polymerase elongator complex component)